MFDIKGTHHRFSRKYIGKKPSDLHLQKGAKASSLPIFCGRSKGAINQRFKKIINYSRCFSLLYVNKDYFSNNYQI